MGPIVLTPLPVSTDGILQLCVRVCMRACVRVCVCTSAHEKGEHAQYPVTQGTWRVECQVLSQGDGGW